MRQPIGSDIYLSLRVLHIKTAVQAVVCNQVVEPDEAVPGLKRAEF